MTPDQRRQLVLAVVAFAATILLLVGLTSVVGGPGPGASGRASASSPASLALSPSASVTTPPSAGPTPQVTASDGPSPDASGATESPSPTPPLVDPVLVGAGDIADCTVDDDEATARLLETIDGTVFTAGDNAYQNGSKGDFTDCYDPTWGRLLERTRPAAGNHDWITDGASGYLGYFGVRAAPDGVTWYSYDLGTWHIVVLDSDCTKVGGCGAESPQGRWLAADLAASQATCTMAIFHHPRFSSGDEHGNDPSVDPLWRALYAAGADVIVNGHDHDYERFAPQDPDGREDRARGIRQFVVGTGGSPLRGFDDPVANSELRASVTHGVLQFTLKDGTYDWAFVPTGTDFGDMGTGPCH